MVRTRNAIDADDAVADRDHDASSRVTRSRQLTFDDMNNATLENGDIEEHERELINSEIHTRRAKRRHTEKPILKSEEKSGEEWENVADHEACLVRDGRRKEHKSVRISVMQSARTSPRRSALRKPRRYLDSDDDELDDDITYEKLARGDHRLGSRRRRMGTPMSAPPAARSSHPRRAHYLHRDGRPKYMYEQDEPRRSGRQRKLLYDTFDQRLIAMMNKAEERNLTEESNKDDSMEMPNEQTDELPPRKRRRQEVDPMPESEMQDMYARVKRKRRQVKRDMYGIPVTEEENEEEEEEQQRGDDDVSSESEEEEQKGRSYSFREHRPRTQMYEINWEEGKRKKHDFPTVFRQHTPPPPSQRRKKSENAIYRSPARRKTNFRRRKAAFHGHSSTSSSSSSSSGGDSSDDERRFERRKAKSMAKSRQRCLPMNMNAEDIATGVLRDRTKIGSSLADIDPMTVDRSVTFESVGGLGKHIQKLKEMIVFPLLYPEVFERFKIQPPRGVLFYGPPGTGKTLVARALANECSQGEKKVAFFMRKGADCLSKWVGESERQLRLLFDQAYQMRPSIIFFDEIDGLAPVRSSRQDQIHSSIVSTLLALMDGLDNRGEIVVIGATNRLDSIDPALRRPGRFDREFLFPLPSVEARRQILQIHTSAWDPKLSGAFLAELGDKCTGYCGADLKALCTEAALHALRRRYPQIYTSSDKLQLDVSKIHVSARDFHHAMQCIVPTAQRSVTSPARALTTMIRPLLSATLVDALAKLQRIFPSMLAQLASLDIPDGDNADELASDSDESGPEISVNTSTPNGKGKRRKSESAPESDTAIGSFLTFTTHASQRPATHRPRMLLSGEEGQGQSTHLAPAVLHQMERLPVHTLDLPALFAVSASTPEQSCAQVFREAKRTAPSIIYMPHICSWWDVIDEACRSTFIMLLKDMEPSTPTLLLATSEQPYVELPTQVRELFSIGSDEVVIMQNPTDSERKEFFEDLLINQATKPPSTRRKAAQRLLEELPVAPAPPPRELTETEKGRLREHEDATLRELRIFLRDVLNKLGKDRKFQIFAKPVDIEEVPDYNEIITNPMDMSTMMSKIDLFKYETVRDFLKDIDLIANNALEYNPASTMMGRAIRHRACALRDMAQATIEQELDRDFEKQCEEIKKARKSRGDSPQKSIPDFYFTKPINRSELKALRLDPKGLQVIDDNSERSRIKRNHRNSRLDSIADEDQGHSTPNEGEMAPIQEAFIQEPVYEEINGERYQVIVRRERMKRAFKSYKSPFCKPTKSRYIHVKYYVDDKGREFTQKELLGEKNEKTEAIEIEEKSTTNSIDNERSSQATTETNISSSPANTSESCQHTDKLEKEKDLNKELTIETDVEKLAAKQKIEIIKDNNDSVIVDLDAEKENLPSPKPRTRSISGSRLSPRSRPDGQLSPRLRSDGQLSPRSQGDSQLSPKTQTSHHSPSKTEIERSQKTPHSEGQISWSRPNIRSPRKANARSASPRVNTRKRSRSPRVEEPTTPVSSKPSSAVNFADEKLEISPRKSSPRTRSADKVVEQEACVDEEKRGSGAYAMGKDTKIEGIKNTSHEQAANNSQEAMETSPSKINDKPESTVETKPNDIDVAAAGDNSNNILKDKIKTIADCKQENSAEKENITDNGDDDETDVMETEEANTSFSKRVTRSKTHFQTSTKQKEKAVSLLKEITPELIIDRESLKNLLETVVEKTRGHKVENLERLYSVLSQCIYHHRKEYDKTQLLQELETSIDKYVTHNQ